tara:strand:- start:937 stop:1683 length:747 start_codon:yes stop_codon:yes gene_type:complete
MLQTQENTQLDLFEGKLLTTKQRLEVQKYIDDCHREVVRKNDESKNIQLLLDEGGFIEGIDYVNNFEIHEKTYTHEFGYSYNNTQWEAEVSVMRGSGGCQIIYDVLRDGKITVEKSYVYREGDKLQCSSFTQQYRFYLVSSLLRKLKENNEDALRKLEIKNRAQTVLEYTVEKYTKLFPNATVTIGADYNRRRNDYTEFKTVIINFTSGSYVIYRLGYANDGEYFHKSFDGAVDVLKGIDLLNHFNNQ